MGSRHKACIGDAVTETLQGKVQVCSESASLFQLGEQRLATEEGGFELPRKLRRI